MKHIKPEVEKSAERLKKKKGHTGGKYKPRNVFEKRRERRKKYYVHPMQWYFDDEAKELARRKKLAIKEGKNAGGRPPVVDEVVITKLEQAFSIDATIEEACSYAGISPMTYNRFIKKSPQFSDRFDALKELPVLLARETIVRNLGYDAKIALEYVTNKRNAEFNKRKDVKLAGTMKLLPKLAEDEAAQIKETFNIFFGQVDAIAEVSDDDNED